MTDLAMDYLGLDALLSAGEIGWRDTVRAFVRDRIRPNIREWYEAAVFPAEIVPEMGRLGLLGTHLSGYGCPGRRAEDLCQRARVAGHERHPQVRYRGAQGALAARNGGWRSDRLLRPDRAGSRQRPSQHDHGGESGRQRLGHQ